MFYEPAEGARPREEVWSTRRYLATIPDVIAAVRDAYGPDLRLLHDVHHRLTPIEAAQLGKALEPYQLFWLEDPVPAELQASLRLVRQHTTTPLAIGEVFNIDLGLPAAHHRAAHRLHPHERRALRRNHPSAARSCTWPSSTACARGCHGATDLSPVCMAAALHLDLAIPNFGLQEYMRHTAETDLVFPHGYGFSDGMLHPGDEPGLGVTMDEELAASFPYQPAMLPGGAARGRDDARLVGVDPDGGLHR